MSDRVDSASRFIPSPPSAVYAAFSDPKAMERWVPPENMTATMLRFEFREDGGYRMRLSYRDAQPRSGKTTDDSDVVEVRFIELLDSHRIVQVVRFESSDASFAGAMRMTWTFDPVGSGTLVTVRAAEVPSGIRPEDHEAGMKSTLDNLASFLAGQPRTE